MFIFLIYCFILQIVLSTSQYNDDKPIQLVRPAADHRNLELVESNLLMLRKIRDPVAVVAVVGKFHSGKSFLMNQLMGKSAGFGIGPTVHPKTMGIWMWGEPMNIVSPKINKKVSIIFLDTEGFAANNVTENYDAKVFAVSTLLSSHLLYNSVKIIDQSDIEYLELLARRTQLFALRSQLSKSKWTSDFNQDMLTFPPLTWVVQDFVQDTHDFETPTEWLQRLMGSHSMSSENYTISLLEIFEKVDCHTLFIPAFDKELLSDLSNARDEDLSADYRRERNNLSRKLRNSIMPKEKSPNMCKDSNCYATGADVAQLIRILVAAANDGSLADVPSRWDTFVDRLQSTASDDCTTFYNRELAAFLEEKNKNEPISMRSFELQHQHIKSKAFELLEQLLQGLDDALNTARRDLSTGIETFYLTQRDLNEKKITIKCGQIKSKLELVADEQLRKIALPVKSDDLRKHADSISSQLVRSFQDELVNLVDASTLQSQTEAFKKSLELLKTSVEAKNKQFIEAALLKIKNSVLKVFNEGIDETREPRKPVHLTKIINQLSQNCDEDYRVKALQYKDESSYEPSLALFEKELRQARERWLEKNQNLAAEKIKNQVGKYSDNFAKKIGHNELVLPMDEANLNSRLTSAGSDVVSEFETMFADFKDCCGYEAQLTKLKESILKIGHEKQQENIRAYREIVKDVLKKAKDLIRVSEEKYGNQYSFRKFVEQVSLSLLSEGKSVEWDPKLKQKVIDDFIHDDEDINKWMDSKRGLLAAIFGFIEYLLSFLGL